MYETLEPVLVEKEKAEEALKASGMEYVIVRPGGLKVRGCRAHCTASLTCFSSALTRRCGGALASCAPTLTQVVLVRTCSHRARPRRRAHVRPPSRPPPQSEPKTGTAVLTEDTTVCGSITREDVGDLVAKCLWSDALVNKTVSALDSTSVEAEFATISA